jgi:iron complex outermembrane recepter protein
MIPIEPDSDNADAGKEKPHIFAFLFLVYSPTLPFYCFTFANPHSVVSDINLSKMKKISLLVVGLLMAGTVALAQQNPDSLKTIHLSEVQVNGVRATSVTPMTYTNVSKEEIAKQNFGQDLPYLLSLTPSIVTTSDAGAGVGYTGLRIRGTDASRINVTINGIPVNDAESHGVYWVDMPDLASSVAGLQIQRGVGSSTNGAGAFGGSINMNTETFNPKHYVEVNSSYGSFNTSKFTVKGGSGLIAKHWAVDARVSNLHSDGYVQRAKTDLSSYFLQGGYYSDKTIIKFLTFGGKEKTYHAWNGIPKDSLATNRTYNPAGHMAEDANWNPIGQNYYPNQTDNYIQTNYQLHLIQALSDAWTLNAALHYTKGVGYYQEYKVGQTFSSYGLNPIIQGTDTITGSNVIRQKWLNNDFYGGVFSVKYTGEKLALVIGGGANNYYGLHYGTVLSLDSVKNSLPVMVNQEYYRSYGNKTDANVYTKANYALTGGLNAYVDLQYRYIDYAIKGQNGESDYNSLGMLDIHQYFHFFNPKGGLNYLLNDNNKLYASVAVAHREPTRSNYTTDGSSLAPSAEQLVDYELGYLFRNQTFNLGVNAYMMDYRNQLILNGKINSVGEALTSNIPLSYRAGLEFSLGVKVTEWLRWNGNLTLSQNKIINYTEYVQTYDSVWNPTSQTVNKLGNTPIAFSPNVTGNSNLMFNFGQLSFALQTIYVGKQYIDNTGSDDRALKAYLVNNFRIGYLFNVAKIGTLGLNLMVNNVLNELYESNAWVYSSYYNNGVTNTRTDLFGYYPQATRNFLLNVVLKF